MKKGFVKKYRRSFKSIVFVLSISFIFLYVYAYDSVGGCLWASAQSIEVRDWDSINKEIEGNTQGKAWWSWEKTWEELKDQLKNAGSKAFHSALTKALNTIAYDTATWIGSGGEGQEPMFITEGWGEYLTNIADNSAGNFLEEIMSSGGFGDFNLCEPGKGAKLNIALGLKQWARPSAPDCTFSKMKNNWEKALDNPNFLNNVQDMFDPVSSDVGITFNAYVKMIAKVDNDKMNKALYRENGGGWLDVRNIGGLAESYPGYSEDQIEQAGTAYWDNLGKYTGSALIDAVNIFLNQLALSLFQNLMKNIGNNSSSYTSPYDWSSNDYDSESYSGGIKGMQDQFAKIIEPDFNIGGDYDILAKLTICPDPTNAGPTNCVIDDKFRQAIQEKATVAQAIKNGYLNSNGIFGFLSNSLEPDYTQAYPYRSMIILRKFRILPIGWELAAQYIKDNIGSTNSVNGSKNLGEMVACFNPSDEYTGFNDNGTEAWCEGLVDPNWVLKAPLNYCGREGYGSYTVNESIVGEDKDSKLLLSRADDYCADEQSCIKEYDDGSCEVYGYCTEEKRKWNFSADSCEPVFNTCQTFTDQKNGQTHSFLENTLSYCDNPGCVAYCEDYDYDNDKYCASPNDSRIYLNSAAECNSEDEGCHEFIRTGAGFGTNMLFNSSYEDDIIPNTAYTRDCTGGAANAVYGNCVLNVTGNIFNSMDLFDGFNYDYMGQIFTFSVYMKGCGDKVEIGIGGDSTWTSNYSTSTVATTDDWQRFSVSHIFDAANSLELKIESKNGGFPAGCYLDAVQVERGGVTTAYQEYRQPNLIYEKLLPKYLEETCYKSTIPSSFNYNQYKNNAPSECFDFARKCNKNEVDCELYKSTTNNITYPAKVLIDDYCPKECVGYSEYIKTSSVFDSQNVDFLIPNKTKTCNSSAVGCTEFTNLDKIGDGAENIERYIELKHCTSTSDVLPNANCFDYYTWEGTGESGFQLRVHKFQKDMDDIDGDGDVEEPAIVEDDTNECNAAIFNLSPTDLGYNFDCREFYDTNGKVTYHLTSRVVSCSDNCHPYRRTDYNVVKNYLGLNITNTECNSSNVDYFGIITASNQIHYNTITGECIFCKSGGVWNDEHSACIYNAIPNEGVKCSAGQVGCREYSGSTGNDMEIVVNDDFESSDINQLDWFDDNQNPLADDISYVASYLPAKKSMLFEGNQDYGVRKILGSLVESGKSYYLSFVASPFIANGNPASKIVSIGLDNGSNLEEFTVDGSTILSPNWKKYEFNISHLSHLASTSELLEIKMDGDFIFDNVRLVKTTERFYLIKNSWNTPDACYYDIFNNPVGERYNLGCDEYTDKEDNYYYLRQFSKSCQDSAVGCELMIDTHNYSEATSHIWNDTNSDSVCDIATDGYACASVDADELVYMVYNPDMLSAKENKGCSRLGEISNYDDGFNSTDLFEDVYRINNPDLYDTMLCIESNLGCKSWLVQGSKVSFTDPGNKYCYYSNGKWLQNKVNRCDDGSGGGSVDGKIEQTTSVPIFPLENNVCKDSNDCDVIPGNISCKTYIDCDTSSVPSGSYACVNGACHYKCLNDDYEYACSVDRDNKQVKTFGTGGYKIEQPTNSWVGSCPSSEAGCSEFVDPVSTFSSDYLINSSFENIINLTNVPSNWNNNTQNTVLKNNTLYSLTVSNGTNIGTVTITTSDSVLRNLDQSNIVEAVSNSLTTNFLGTGNNTLVFFVDSDSNTDTISAEVSYTDTSNDKGIYLRETEVSYRFEQDIDSGSCNGMVDYAAGCVLFNKREISPDPTVPLNYSDLSYDADANYLALLAVSPVSCAGTSCDSNNIYSVSLDRACNEWLACKSFVKDEDDKNVCLDIGLCNYFNSNNNCANFIHSLKENQNYNFVPTMGNTSTNNNLNFHDVNNRSGYVIAGYTNSSLQKGLYPISEMEQTGGLSYIPNGSFEEYGTDGYPLGWYSIKEDSQNAGEYIPISWTDDKFRVINNPVEAQNNGVGYPADGKTFLRFSPASSNIESDFIDVDSDVDYVLSAYINTLNFKINNLDINDLAAINIQIFPFKKDGSAVSSLNGFSACTDQPLADSCGMYLVYGSDWTKIMSTFTLKQGVEKIKLRIDGLWWSNLDMNTGIWGDSADCYNTNDCVGEAYLDNITLNSALNINYSSFNKPFSSYLPVDIDWMTHRWEIGWLKNQTCRLYPESDSLSCKYQEDSGIIRKGWPGYCLQHDRYPGNSDTCLLWYPVDRVKGDIKDEGAGYKDQVPLYYSIESGEDEDTVVTRNNFITLDATPPECPAMLPENVASCFTGNSMPGPSGAIDLSGGRSACNEGSVIIEIKPNELESASRVNKYNINYIEFIGVPGTPGKGKLDVKLKYSSTTDEFFTDYYFGKPTYSHPYASVFFDSQDKIDKMYFAYRDTSGSCDKNDHISNISIKFYLKKFYAKKIVQVVTPLGQNKYWSGRVYAGSIFELNCNEGLLGLPQKCNYTSIYPPFGSIIPPGDTQNIISNPYEWDGEPDEYGIQPMIYSFEAEDTLPISGQFYSKENLQHLFAESYGVWEWNGVATRYEKIKGEDWTPPDELCPGGVVRAPYNDSDLAQGQCGLPPVIFNQTVDNFAIQGGDFINLTFNTFVNSQQLPLKMYKIDWGDGDIDIVAGATMLDRPSTSNPHSLYHYYDYWTLLSKASMNNNNSIYCSLGQTPNACKFKIGIKVKDNWGWCNNGVNLDPCPISGYKYTGTEDIYIYEE